MPVFFERSASNVCLKRGNLLLCLGLFYGRTTAHDETRGGVSTVATQKRVVIVVRKLREHPSREVNLVVHQHS